MRHFRCSHAPGGWRARADGRAAPPLLSGAACSSTFAPAPPAPQAGDGVDAARRDLRVQEVGCHKAGGSQRRRPGARLLAFARRHAGAARPPLPLSRRVAHVAQVPGEGGGESNGVRRQVVVRAKGRHRWGRTDGRITAPPAPSHAHHAPPCRTPPTPNTSTRRTCTPCQSAPRQCPLQAWTGGGSVPPAPA